MALTVETPVKPGETVEVYARKGSRLTDEQARSFDAFVSTLPLTRRDPEHIVEAAKDPNCSIHHLYDWDVEQAAQEHWLALTRTYIRSIVVKVVKTDARKLEIPKYHRVPVAPTPGTKAKFVYATITEAEREQQRVDYIIKTARSELVAFTNKVRSHDALFAQHAPRILGVAEYADEVLSDDGEEETEE